MHFNDVRNSSSVAPTSKQLSTAIIFLSFDRPEDRVCDDDFSFSVFSHRVDTIFSTKLIYTVVIRPVFGERKKKFKLFPFFFPRPRSLPTTTTTTTDTAAGKLRRTTTKDTVGNHDNFNVAAIDYT